MSDCRFEKLTEKQCESLRLVATGLSGKEIARRLDATPDAIRERLRAAREHLGVGTSRLAAREFVAWEQKRQGRTYMDAAEPYTFGVEAPKSLGETPSTPPSGLATGVATSDRAGAKTLLHEQRVTYSVDPVQGYPSHRSDFWLDVGRRPNDLSATSRMAVILLLAILILLAGGVGIEAFIHLSAYMVELSRKGG